MFHSDTALSLSLCDTVRTVSFTFPVSHPIDGIFYFVFLGTVTGVAGESRDS